MKIQYIEKPFEDEMLINGKDISDCSSKLVGELFARLHKHDKYMFYRIVMGDVLFELLEEVDEHYVEDDGITYYTYEGEI